MASEDLIIRGPPSTCPPLEKSLGHEILKHLTEKKDRVYQIDPYTNITQTQGEIKLRSIRVALELRRLGLQKGDVMAICTTNHLNTALPVLAALYLGVTINPLDDHFNDYEIGRMLDLMKPKLIFSDDSAIERFRKIVKNLQLDAQIYLCNKNFEENFIKESEMENNFEPEEVDIYTHNAFIICSSGTTGLMKGIQHTHHSFYHAVYDTKFVANENDRMYTCTTLVWNAAPWLVLYCVFFGSTRFTVPYTIDPIDTFEYVKNYKITHMNTTPTTVMTWLMHPDLDKYPEMQNVRVLWARGSPNSKEQMELYRQKFPKTHIMNAIGCTEMAMLMAYFDPNTEFDLNVKKIYSNGRLCPGVQGKIIDPKSGSTLARNQEGELLLKSKSMTPGYYKNPEANKSTFTEDGWYRTGDLAYFDDDDCLFVIGRLKEMIKYWACTVIPSEVQNIINELDGVAESCVMGVPDRIYGELPMAFVVKKSGSDVSEEDVIRIVDEKGTDTQKLRGGVRFVDQFPKTPSGKIKRYELKKLLE